MNPIPQKLHDKFFTDPDWSLVEKTILDYINPLIEMKDIDITQSAESVKAEVIGRLKAYESLSKFLADTKIVQGRGTNNQVLNPFQ